MTLYSCISILVLNCTNSISTSISVRCLQRLEWKILETLDCVWKFINLMRRNCIKCEMMHGNTMCNSMHCIGLHNAVLRLRLQNAKEQSHNDNRCALIRVPCAFMSLMERFSNKYTTHTLLWLLRPCHRIVSHIAYELLYQSKFTHTFARARSHSN